MAAWTEAERAQVRALLGFPSLFFQAEPRLEHALNSVQAVADGGLRPDDSDQARMRTALVAITAIEARITSLYCSLDIDSAGTENVKINASRALIMLKGEGRRLISQIAIPLNTQPVRDYFSSSLPVDINGRGSPFNF